MPPTVDDVRTLARHSRRTAAWGVLAVVGTLLLFPLVALVLAAAPSWHAAATYAATATGGLLFLRFAFVAGAERGAYRALFRRLRAEGEARRVLVPEGPPPGPSEEVFTRGA